MKVSFDFDGVLSRPHVQTFARELIAAGVDVWVVTTRFESLDAFARHPPDPAACFYDNADIEHVTTRLGIPAERVLFTNWAWKSAALGTQDFVWHLDDCAATLREIQRNCPRVRAISAFKTTLWRRKCLRALAELGACVESSGA